VNLALPRPVPIVGTPQRSTSRMNGISLKPGATASLCSATAHKGYHHYRRSHHDYRQRRLRLYHFDGGTTPTQK
jgi:hypothetical protein